MGSPLQLPDGYIDVPRGKIANVQTCLEMFERPQPRPDPQQVECTLERLAGSEVERYRALFRRVGEAYLWFSRLTISREELASAIADPRDEIYAIRYRDRDEGLLELDFRTPEECELLYFGLTDTLVGKGVGRWAMNRAIDLAWSRPIRRFWVHTCSLDHPDALAFYIRTGFKPFKRQIEVADDPRLTGVVSPNAAPHVPML
jgi:GNAT superfamily N-acetyltransferase